MFAMVFMTVIFSTTSPEGDIEFYPETSFPTYETEAKCHAALLQLAAEHELEITQTGDGDPTLINDNMYNNTRWIDKLQCVELDW